MNYKWINHKLGVSDLIKLQDVPAEALHHFDSVPRPSAALLHVSGSALGNAHPSHRLQLAASSTEDKKKKTPNHSGRALSWNLNIINSWQSIVTCSVCADSFSWSCCSVDRSRSWSPLLFASSCLSLFLSSWSSSSTAASPPVKELSGLWCRQNRCSSQIKKKTSSLIVSLWIARCKRELEEDPMSLNKMIQTYCCSSLPFQFSYLFGEWSHLRFGLKFEFSEAGLSFIFLILPIGTKKSICAQSGETLLCIKNIVTFKDLIP